MKHGRIRHRNDKPAVIQVDSANRSVARRRIKRLLVVPPPLPAKAKDSAHECISGRRNKELPQCISIYTIPRIAAVRTTTRRESGAVEVPPLGEVT